ncbi:MAG: tetratricopeptide repeat protein [Deltaproteobacteria bacterium]|nr:tetratricopeptide repeat protein [Deltaproteobacteria bacterium]
MTTSTGRVHEATAQTPAAGRSAALGAALSHRATVAYREGRYAEAAKLYRAAYAAAPAHIDLLYGVGRAEQRAGNCDEALAAITRLEAALPVVHKLRARCARVRMACGGSAGGIALPSAVTGHDDDDHVLGIHSVVDRAVAPGGSAPPGWALPTTIGLAATGAGAWIWAAIRTVELDAQVGRLDGATAARKQRDINVISGVAVGTLSLAASGVIWMLLSGGG